jgi:hypothetical protein
MKLAILTAGVDILRQLGEQGGVARWQELGLSGTPPEISVFADKTSAKQITYFDVHQATHGRR